MEKLMNKIGLSDKVTVDIHNLKINGYLSKSNTANFLNIPFAEIPARFRQSRLLDPRQMTGTIDGTQYGPICPQPPDVGRGFRTYLFEGIEPTTSTQVSEFGCLRLNIYAPPDVVGTSKRIPVLVWIHGGGWTFGDGNSDYTGEFLTRYSVDAGRPMIYVAINYRLGYFGFLSSDELKEEGRKYGEVGYANPGLYDQRLGLQWVQQNIHFFGGDGFDVTLAGESAGAWSTIAHIRSDFPACQRAWIMSSPSLPFAPLETTQKTFDSLIEKLGMSAAAPASDKIAALRAVSPEELKAFLGSAYSIPNPDPLWFKDIDVTRGVSEHADRFPSWLRGIVISSMAHELEQFFRQSLKTYRGAAEAFKKNIVDDSLRGQFLAGAGITSEDDDETALDKMAKGYTFGRYESASYTIANQTTTPVSICRFDQTDTHEGSVVQGWAYHALDCAYFCRLPAVAGEKAPPELKATADAYSEALLDFIYGKQPWEEYNESKKIMVFNGTKTGLIHNDPSQQWGKLMDTPEKHAQFTHYWRGFAKYM